MVSEMKKWSLKEVPGQDFKSFTQEYEDGANNSVLVSCQPQWVTSGQPNSVTGNCTLKYTRKDFRKGGFKEGCSLILANLPQGFLCDNTDTV